MFAKPPIVPPKEYPRLLLCKRHLPELREKMTHPELKESWERLLAFADFAPDEVDADHSPGDVYVVEANALLYLLNEDREAGLKAKELVMRSITKKFNPGFQDISRDIGRLMLAGSIVYDWCRELVSDDERKLLISHFKRLAGLLECGYPPLAEGAFVGHSCEWMIMRDLLGTGIAIYDEDPEMYDLAAGRFFGQLVEARNFFYPSGWHHQGDAYGGVRFQCELYPTFLFDRMGFGNVYDESQARVGYQWIYARRPDGKLLRDGDTDPPQLRTGSYTRLTFIYGLLAGYYKDPYFKYQQLHEGARVQDKDLLFYFLFADPHVASKPLAELPLTRYFEAPAGIMVARTGWKQGKDSPDVLCEMKVGMYQYNNHQHLDAGSFQLYYKGNLAIDTGSYKGSSGKYHSPHNKYYFKRTIAHNCLLVYDPDELSKYPYVKDGGLVWPNVNDGGQRWPNDGKPPLTMEELLNGEFKRAEVLGHEFGPDSLAPGYTYLKGDLTAAYSDKVRRHQRSFVFLNFKDKEHPAALFVFDNIVSANRDFGKYWLLHSIEEPVVDGITTTVSRSEDGYTGQLVNHTLLPHADNLQINKVGGPGKEYWVFGTNFVNDHPGTNEQGQWRIEVMPRQAAEQDYFLNVMQVKDTDGAAPLPARRVETERMAGAFIHGWVVLFGKNGERIGEAFDIVVRSEENDMLASGSDDEREGASGLLKYVIADVAAGAWMVEQYGRSETFQVTEAGGVLHFSASAGLIRITPVHEN